MLRTQNKTQRLLAKRYVQLFGGSANLELYCFERTVFEKQFDGLTASNAYAKKNKLVKKSTHSTAQNTLSFFCNPQPHPEKNERVFSPPKKTKTKNSTENGAVIL